MKTGKTLQELAAEIERQHKTKKDYIADLGSVAMTAPLDGRPGLEIAGINSFGVTAVAHEQIAEHTKIPKRYYDKMLAEDPVLLGANVNAWFKKYPAPRMVRTLDGNARAFLSDKFQTLDNYDFAGATLPILSQRKLTVMSCEITEKRLYIKAVDERLFRDVPVGHRMGDGTHTIFDTCAPVVILSNSEVGFGRLVVDTGIYTKGCTNMSLWANGGMKRTHVGARHKLTDSFVENLDDILSDETKRKTMAALWGQVRDVIAAAFDEKVLDKRLANLAAAAKQKITGKVDKVVEVVTEQLSLSGDEAESVFKHLIEGGSLTKYGLHSAITRTAQDVESYDRATELEYMGGKVIDLTASDWDRIAEAA